jgi:hypothetical protein
MGTGLHDLFMFGGALGPLSLLSGCFGGGGEFVAFKLANTSSYTPQTHKIVSTKDLNDEDDDHHPRLPSWWW